MIPNSWLVILDDGRTREELLTRTMPGLALQYAGIRWRRMTARDVVQVATFAPAEPTGHTTDHANS